MSVLPLEKQEIKVIDFKTDRFHNVSVLDKSLCRSYVPHCLYVTISDHLTKDDYNEYSSIIDQINSALQWVLSLCHSKFWCQVLHDEGLHKILDSYLKFAPRYERTDWCFEFKQKHDLLHKNVFMIFLRLSTPKESATCFITPQVFGELIYSNFLFDIPRIMDLCCLYGNNQNQPLLKKLVESVFKHQENYLNDLVEVATVITEVLDKVEDAINDKDQQKLSSKPLIEMPESKFSDIIIYISDIFSTLNIFIGDIFPKATHPFFEAGMIEKIILFYSLTKRLRNALTDRSENLNEEKTINLLAHLQIAKKSIISFGRSIIYNEFVQPIIEITKGDQSKDLALVEHLAFTYIYVLHSLIDEEIFIKELNRNDVITKDFKDLLETYPDITNIPLCDEVLKKLNVEKKQKKVLSKVKLRKPLSKITENTDEDIELASSASIITDIFPHLQMSFIKRCLLHYNRDTERLTQDLLENNLPPHLQDSNSFAEDQVEQFDDADVDLPGCSGIKSSMSSCQDLVSERKNYFDNDDFDLFGANSSRVDTSKIHFGKKDKNYNHWKDDTSGKEEMNKLKDFYSKYLPGFDEEEEEEEDTIPVNPNYVCDYEDERDDFVDGLKIGVDDGDYESKQFQSDLNFKNNNSDEKGKNLDFVRNPEEVRAEKERKRQQRQELNQKNRRPQKVKDSDKQQAIDYKRKDQNKAKRANHNRKMGATKKMNGALKG